MAEKFYYLLCLFSTSNANKSETLLKALWKYCANLYNKIEINTGSYLNYNWLKKISDIDIDLQKTLLIISAIVDGNIFRGPVDEKKVFEKFHNAILIFITLQKQVLDKREIIEALASLKEKAVFYRWLIDNNRLVPK